MRRSGMYLIEVLLISIVVLVLGAVLYPVFAPSHHHGRQYECLNNQRQLAIAIAMYADDHHGRVFPATPASAWTVWLQPYDGTEIYNCPSSIFDGDNAHPEYGFNAALFGQPTAAVAHPAVMLLTADLARAGMHGAYAFTATPTDPDYYGTIIDRRHNLGFCGSYLDGHIAYLPLKMHDVIADTLKNAGTQVALPVNGK